MHAKNLVKASWTGFAKPYSSRRGPCNVRQRRFGSNYPSQRKVTCLALEDHITAAEARLSSLIDNAGDGEEELLNSMVTDASGETKFGVYLIWSFLVMGGSILICSKQRIDPYGGASFSLESFKCALLGAAVAFPISCYKLGSWDPELRRRKELRPIVELHKTWLSLVQPMFSNVSSAQTIIIIAMESLTNCMFAYSTLQVSIAKLLQWNQAAGLEIPERCLMNVSLAIVACLSGWVNMGYRSPPLDQLDVVEDAASNADRYYRFVVPADEKNTAAEMAAAFKSTCRQWYVDRRVAMYAVGVSSTFEVVICGCLWRWTGDLSAAVAATLLFNAPDYIIMNMSIKDPKTWS